MTIRLHPPARTRAWTFTALLLAGSMATLPALIEHRLGNQSGVTRYVRQLRESFPDSRELRLYERGAWNN